MIDMGPLYIRFDSPELLIWAACIGFNLAMILTFIVKGSVCNLILKLIDAGATSEDSAVTLVQIGVKSPLIRFMLREGSTLRRVVMAQGGSLPIKKSEKGKEQIDFEAGKIYLDTSCEKKISSLKKGVFKWWLIPICTVVSIVIAVAVIALLPVLSIV